jgi:hypothetical protein
LPPLSVCQRPTVNDVKPSWLARSSWRVQGLRSKSQSPRMTGSTGKPLRPAACSISEATVAERVTPSCSSRRVRPRPA